MRSSVGLLVAYLSLLLKAEGGAHSGHCTDKHCFALYRDSRDFETAQERCKSDYGHLMTIRSVESHKIVSGLLGGFTGQYWIGLHLPNGECPNNSTALRGYRWTTGEEDGTSDFHNWGDFESGCSPCVSVSAVDNVWMEEMCDSKIEGFLCEYPIQGSCNPITIKGDESVMYKTYYGFEVKDLSSLPAGTIAIHRTLEWKAICFEDWMRAPWSCDIANGGCDVTCLPVNQQHTCGCPPDKAVHSNKVSCRDRDPCDDLGCAHLCAKKDDSSYECACHPGHAPKEDGKTCTDVDECVADNRPCPEHAECVNTIGGFDCPCLRGYELENEQCVPLNPCISSPCEHDCTASTSGYDCSCRVGFSVSKDDPNRCDRLCSSQECPTECDPNTHQCRCPDGYVTDERDGQTFCVDIDECEYNCLAQNCTNTHGGYSCSCYEGYGLVGGICEKISDSTTARPTEFSRPAVHPTERPYEAKAGSVLGIILCTVAVILGIITIIYHTRKHCCGKFEIAVKSKDSDIYYLQQITTEKYKKLSFDGQLKYET